MSTTLARASSRVFGCIALLMSMAALAAPLDTIQLMREGGCGGLVPYTPPLNRSARLDRAALSWSHGSSFKVALFTSGYPAAEPSSGLHVYASEPNLLLVLRNSCKKITDPAIHDLGLYTKGRDHWIVLGSAGGQGEPPPLLEASRAKPPQILQAAPQARRILALINAARARATVCGSHTFAPVPPVSLSTTLDEVALGHAVDMATHNYFEHEDLSGHSPADRVRAVGYREKLVGENIAYGVENADEAVQGWLDSPGHCENIMDPRFAEMGVGFAPGRSSHHGLYWVQLFAQPKA